MSGEPRPKEPRPKKVPKGLRRVGMKRKAVSSKGEFTPAARNEVERRSGGRCEAMTSICRGPAVHIHHILRRSQGGKGTADNGLHVCQPCHTFLHDHPEMAYARGWMVRGSGRRNADVKGNDPEPTRGAISRKDQTG